MSGLDSAKNQNSYATTAATTSTSGDSNSNNNSDHRDNSTEALFYTYEAEQRTFLYILLVLIVTGNTLVIAAIFASWNRKSRMRIFILNLAFADLSVGLVNVLTDIVWKNTVEWHAGHLGCKLVRYGQIVVTYASTYALVALSLDRLNAIARPLSFSQDKSRIRLLLGLCWGLAGFFSLPMLVIAQAGHRDGYQQCYIAFSKAWMWQFYMTSIAVVLFFLPAIIIAVCYIVIVIIIWRKTSANGLVLSGKTTHFVQNGQGSHVTSRCRETMASSRGVIPRAKMKTIKMTLVIVIVFVVCWSPYFIFDLLVVYNCIPKTGSWIATNIFFQTLAPLNCVANPIIYAGFNLKTCSNPTRSRFSGRNSSPTQTSQVTQFGPRRTICD